MREYRTLLVPFDFSAHARMALETAADLARRFGSDLHLLYVVQPPIYATTGVAAMPVDYPMDLEETTLDSLRGVADAIAGLSGRGYAHVLQGINIPSAIVQCAEEIKADLIVMGTHGRTGLKHAFMGRVAERTLRSAGCPVLTLRATEG